MSTANIYSISVFTFKWNGHTEFSFFKIVTRGNSLLLFYVKETWFIDVLCASILIMFRAVKKKTSVRHQGYRSNNPNYVISNRQDVCNDGDLFTGKRRFQFLLIPTSYDPMFPSRVTPFSVFSGSVLAYFFLFFVYILKFVFLFYSF